MIIDGYILVIADKINDNNTEVFFETHKSDILKGFNLVNPKNYLFANLDVKLAKQQIGIITYDLLKYINKTSKIKELSQFTEWLHSFTDEDIAREALTIGVLIALQADGLIDSKFVIDREVFDKYANEISGIITQDIKGDFTKLQIKEIPEKLKIEKFDFLDLVFSGQAFFIGRERALDNLKAHYESNNKPYLYAWNNVGRCWNSPRNYISAFLATDTIKRTHSLLKGLVMVQERVGYELNLPVHHPLLSFFSHEKAKEAGFRVIDLNHFYEQEQIFKETLQ